MGDDYINLESGKNIGNFGVRKAVDEFCLKEKLPCLYTADWYINGNYNVDALYGGKIYDQVFENILYKARNLVNNEIVCVKCKFISNFFLLNILIIKLKK